MEWKAAATPLAPARAIQRPANTRGGSETPGLGSSKFQFSGVASRANANTLSERPGHTAVACIRVEVLVVTQDAVLLIIVIELPSHIPLKLGQNFDGNPRQGRLVRQRER